MTMILLVVCMCNLSGYAVQYFPEYGPSFELDVIPSYVRNLNTEAYTESIVCTVLSMCCNPLCYNEWYKLQHFSSFC